MRIAVIGGGNVGGTLGQRWASLGHEVVFGLRGDRKRGREGDDTLPENATVASLSDAARGADVVLLAIPWAAVPDVIRELGDTLDGVTLLDATNSLGPGLRVDAGPAGESGAERIQQLAPKARVAKVFNTTGYNNMRDPHYGGVATVMFYAGDDAQAKQTAATLATSLGFEAVDAGALARARELEHFAVLWISLAGGGDGVTGLGREIAFRLVRR